MHMSLLKEDAALTGHAWLQDADIGGYDAVKKVLQKYGGKAFKALSANMKAAEAAAEGDRRHAITEILFFASTGDIKRMQVLCDAHGIKVDAPSTSSVARSATSAEDMPLLVMAQLWQELNTSAVLRRCRTRPAVIMTSALPCESLLLSFV